MADRVRTLPSGKLRELTVLQAADTLGVTTETVRRAIRSRELLAHHDPFSRGYRYLINAADLAAFIEKRRIG